MKRRDRGVSLAEAIVACFILTFAMLVSAALYHTALQHSVRIDRRQLAARVAEQKIEEIRSWSRANHGTNGTMNFVDGWDTLEVSGETLPEYPGYEMTVDIEPHQLFSPSSEFEKIYFAALEDENVPDPNPDPSAADDPSKRRMLSNSAFLATIEVKWGTGSAERILTRTIFADPVRDHGWDPENADEAISLEYRLGGSWSSGAPASVSPNGEIRVRAFVEDKDGNRVQDAVVTWYVDPASTGNGTIESEPLKPDEAIFRNQVEVDPDPTDGVSGIIVTTKGSVQLVARVRLGGVEAVQKTPLITLD